MSKAKELVTQRDISKHLIEVLGELIDQVDRVPLNQKIVALCTTKLSLPLLLLNQAEIEKLALIHNNWIITLLWVLRFESKSFRDSQYPFCIPEFQFLEPLGRKIHADLLLWDACLSFIDKFLDSQAFNYSTAINEWYATTQERMLCSYQVFPCKVTLRETIDYLNKEISLLKEIENPHDSDQKPHLYNLIELARTIGKINPLDSIQIKRAKREFREVAWKPYITAHRKWCQRLSKTDKTTDKGNDFNPLMTYIDGEKMKAILPGRQTKTLYPPPVKSFLKQTRKKK